MALFSWRGDAHCMVIMYAALLSNAPTWAGASQARLPLGEGKPSGNALAYGSRGKRGGLSRRLSAVFALPMVLEVSSAVYA